MRSLLYHLLAQHQGYLYYHGLESLVLDKSIQRNNSHTLFLDFRKGRGFVSTSRSLVALKNLEFHGARLSLP